MPPLVTAAAAADVALLAQGTLTGIIAALVAPAALYVAFRAAPVTMTLTSLGVAVLLAVGVLATSQIPVVAQVSDAAAAAKKWEVDRADAFSCAYAQLAAVQQDPARPGLVQGACSSPPAANGYAPTPEAW